ncbi:hypothetical protein [uncultured Methanobrevibacter sp.]|uniref:hypothetical protein n=1 Tax=uncultured Methanobrevibacter sp. TaxID=253161 RepID=UPI0025F5D8B1|nr:hypothetical protein [uncultured Methanobrevibacter sp.]
MIVRKLNFLMPPDGYKKVEANIIEEDKVCAIYIKNKGYCFYINDEEDDMFLINTNLAPDEFKLDQNAQEKEDFINLVKILLDQIYEGVDIPEYEKQHHKFVFLKIMDLFNTDAIEIIDNDSDLYKKVELGFIKLDIDLLNIK